MVEKCEHNKFKYYCNECPGPGICEHNKRRPYCKDCNGSQFCEHDKRKSRCKNCKSCPHNKVKEFCVQCNLNILCEHNIQKQNCIECNGTNICEHNNRKNRCKECKGSDLCNLHQKSGCKICRTGPSFCNHNKIKVECLQCFPEKGCKNCKLEIRSRNKTYRPYCFKCYCVLNPDIEIPRRYKTKENLLAEALKENLDIKFIQDKRVNGGCSLRRPDFLFELFTHTVIVECDENDHKDYSTTCEIAKLNETFTDLADLADRPMILIRFNPDNYEGKSCFDKECKLIKSEWNKRIKVLKKELKKAIKEIPEELITIIKLF